MKLLRNIIKFILNITPDFITGGKMTCEDAATLLVVDNKISFRRRQMLKIHAYACECCIKYRKQLDVISIKSSQIADIKLSDEQVSKMSSDKADIINKFTK